MKKIIKCISLLCTLIVALTFIACKTESGGNLPDYSADSTIVKDGYNISGASEPTTPYWCAYEINRVFENEDLITVLFSFGTNEDFVEECTKVVAAIQTQDRNLYILDEISPENFFTDKYKVQFNTTFERDKDGKLIGVIGEEINFSYTGEYQFPISLCNEQSGSLMLVLLVYSEDKLIDNTGAAQTLFYNKNNGIIQFQTYREYYSQK